MLDHSRTTRLAIVVGGGPAPGINSAIRAATIEAINSGAEVWGILDGFQHLMMGRVDMVRRLDIPEVSSIHFQRGSILRTSRTNPTSTPESLDRTLDALTRLGVNGLLTIGGVNTAFAASQLSKRAAGKVRVVHLPKTIDNDLPLPVGISTFGFETARYVGTEMLLNLKEDSRTTGRWYFVGVMGHVAGHLALEAGSAAGATLSVIPEEFPEDQVPLSRVAKVLEGAILKRAAMGRSDGLAVIAEGVATKLDARELAEIPEVEVEHDPYGQIRLAEIPLATILKREVRRNLADRGRPTTIVDVALGYELRCAPPVPFDIDYTRTLGYAASKALVSEREATASNMNGMLYIKDGDVEVVPFEDILDPDTGRTRTRLVNIDGEGYKVARRYMIRLEKQDLENPEMLDKLAETAATSPSRFAREFGLAT